MEHQELLSGLIRLHLPYHAADGDIYGQWMIDGIGTTGLSCQCHNAPCDAAEGYLEFQTEQASRSQRRLYRATPYGIKSLAQAQEKIRELFHEVGPKNEGS